MSADGKGRARATDATVRIRRIDPPAGEPGERRPDLRVEAMREAFGAYLRERRAGRDLAEVARVTRIPEARLRSLEAGDVAGLPPDVFVRGYLRSYAGHLGLDAGELLSRWDEARVDGVVRGERVASGSGPVRARRSSAAGGFALLDPARPTEPLLGPAGAPARRPPLLAVALAVVAGLLILSVLLGV